MSKRKEDTTPRFTITTKVRNVLGEIATEVYTPDQLQKLDRYQQLRTILSRYDVHQNALSEALWLPINKLLLWISGVKTTPTDVTNPKALLIKALSTLPLSESGELRKRLNMKGATIDEIRADLLSRIKKELGLKDATKKPRKRRAMQ